MDKCRNSLLKLQLLTVQQFRMQRPEEKCQSKMKSPFLKDYYRFSSLPWVIQHFKCYAFLAFFTFEGGKITTQHSDNKFSLLISK